MKRERMETGRMKNEYWKRNKHNMRRAVDRIINKYTHRKRKSANINNSVLG
jgi:hypothetical protein